MTAPDDEPRDRRLLFSAELAAGTVDEAAIARALPRRALRGAAVPPTPVRVLQRLRMKAGRLTYEGDTVARLDAARRAVLGAAAAGPPRLLVRVDEFPHYLAGDEPARYGTEAFRRFHAILAEAGMPYLIAVPPRVSERPLDPGSSRWRGLDDGELAQLQALRDDGVAFGVHGLDHRTRHADPRRHSELCGLGAEALRERLAAADEELAAAGVRPRVFVPPFNRFDAGQWDVLAGRYDVVGGGPESVALLGYQDGPSWRGDAVWLPAYPPLYGRAAEVLPAVRRLAAREAALWVPVVLHWGWEADAGWSALERFAAECAALAAPWSAFLAAVDASR